MPCIVLSAWVAVNKSEIGLRVLVFPAMARLVFPIGLLLLFPSPLPPHTAGPKKKTSPTLQHAAQRMVFERKESNCVKSAVRW